MTEPRRPRRETSFEDLTRERVDKAEEHLRQLLGEKLDERDWRFVRIVLEALAMEAGARYFWRLALVALDDTTKVMGGWADDKAELMARWAEDKKVDRAAINELAGLLMAIRRAPIDINLGFQRMGVLFERLELAKDDGPDGDKDDATSPAGMPIVESTPPSTDGVPIISENATPPVRLLPAEDESQEDRPLRRQRWWHRFRPNR